MTFPTDRDRLHVFYIISYIVKTIITETICLKVLIPKELHSPLFFYW